MAGTNPPFKQASLTVLGATTASAGGPLAGGGDTAMITNATTGVAWVTFGTGSATAVLGSGTPVLPGAMRAVAWHPSANVVAVILSAGSGVVAVETGTGR